jgi:hypothetical protein
VHIRTDVGGVCRQLLGGMTDSFRSFPDPHNDTTQKYGHVAFDPAQKAVLTSCVLRYKPSSNTAVTASSGSNGSSQVCVPSHFQLFPPNPAAPTQSSPVWHRRAPGQDGESNSSTSQTGLINCCFSFTIRRDTWGIPSVIVGTSV